MTTRSSNRSSKVKLVAKIRELEEEIEKLHAFYAMPLISVDSAAIDLVRNTSGFISTCQYVHGRPSHGEIGMLGRIRFREEMG